MTFPYNELLSGFIGALAGSMLSYLGASRLQTRGEKGRQRAAGRALLTELQTNLQGLIALFDDLASSRLPAHSAVNCGETVWHTAQSPVAHLLNWRDLQAIATAYIALARLLSDLTITDGHVPSGDRSRVSFGPRVRELVSGFKEASKRLAPKVLSTSELSDWKKHFVGPLETNGW